MVFVECYLDTYIIEFFGYDRREIDHSGGISAVLLDLARTSGEAIGMIDEDPHAIRQPRLVNYSEVKRSHNIRVLRHNDVEGRVVVVIPYKIEDFLTRIADAEVVDPGIFGLLRQSGSFYKSYEGLKKQRFFDFLDKISSNVTLKKLQTLISTYQK